MSLHTLYVVCGDGGEDDALAVLPGCAQVSQCIVLGSKIGMQNCNTA